MKIGRSARTGRFTKVSTARKSASTHVVETIRRGGSKPKPKTRK